MHQSTGKKNKILIYLIFFLILSTTNGKYPKTQKNYSLKINEINVTGLSNSENLEIQNELNNIFYQNLFILGKDEIHKIIKNHNIVEEYNVKKIYPSILNIDIKPTKFLAKLTGVKQQVVGANGKLISSKANNEILPYIFGKFNSKEFLEFKKKVELSKFNFSDFKTVYFFPSSRWDILTINDTLIKLPKKNMTQSLNLAYKIITNSQLNDKSIIDLRVINHLIVK
jgi:cell division protein FtsQ